MSLSTHLFVFNLPGINAQGYSGLKIYVKMVNPKYSSGQTPSDSNIRFSRSSTRGMHWCIWWLDVQNLCCGFSGWKCNVKQLHVVITSILHTHQLWPPVQLPPVALPKFHLCPCLPSSYHAHVYNILYDTQLLTTWEHTNNNNNFTWL